MIADRREKRKWYNATYYNKLHPDVPAKKNKRSKEGMSCSRCGKEKIKETGHLQVNFKESEKTFRRWYCPAEGDFEEWRKKKIEEQDKGGI